MALESAALTITTIAVALIAIGVSAWQGWLQKQNLKHALYERRLQVYFGVLDYLHEWASGATDRQRGSAKLSLLQREAEFLFDEKVMKFIEELITNGIRYSTLSSIIDRGVAESVRLNAAIEERCTLQEWNLSAAREARELFSPYLRLSDGDISS